MQAQSQGSPSKARREVSEYLTESTEGMYLAGNHARMIWQGNKSLIVKAVNFKQALGKVFYVIGANDCYGAIKIKSINEITLNKFRGLEGKHRITEKERKLWFPGKKVLYAYEFDEVQRFDLPKRVSVPQETKTFLKEVKFLSDSVPSFANKFCDVTLIEDFVSLVDSPMKKNKHNGVNLMVRSADLSDCLKEAIEAKTDKMNVDVKGFHFLYESEEPSNSFIPLYDLALVKREPRLVKNPESLVPFQSFNLMEPSKKFYDEKELLDYLFGGS